MNAPLHRVLLIAAASMTAGCASLDSAKLVSYGHELFERMQNSHNDDVDDAPVASKETGSPHRSEAASLPRNASSQVVRPPAVHQSPRWGAKADRILPNVARHDATIAQDCIGERASRLTSASPVTLISPDTPLAEVGVVVGLWELYKAFEFQRVIAYAEGCSISPKTSKYEAVTVFTLAAASAYLSEDSDKALALLRQAFRANRDARPDAKYFPSLFCAMYQKVCEEDGQNYNSTGGVP